MLVCVANTEHTLQVHKCVHFLNPEEITKDNLCHFIFPAHYDPLFLCLQLVSIPAAAAKYSGVCITCFLCSI